MTVTAYGITMMVGTGTSADPRRPTLLFPEIQGLIKMIQAAIYCRDLNDNSARGNAGASVTRVVKEIGPFAVVEGAIDDDVWAKLVAGGLDASPIPLGTTLEELKTRITLRRTTLYAKLAAAAPNVANALGTDPSLYAAKVRTYLSGITATNASVEALRVWIVAKLNGDTALVYPQGMFEDHDAPTFAGIKAFATEYQNATAADHPRLIPVLWALAYLSYVEARF